MGTLALVSFMLSWPRLWFLDVSSLPPSLTHSLNHSLSIPLNSTLSVYVHVY